MRRQQRIKVRVSDHDVRVAPVPQTPLGDINACRRDRLSQLDTCALTSQSAPGDSRHRNDGCQAGKYLPSIDPIIRRWHRIRIN